jgi:hypothetical protein
MNNPVRTEGRYALRQLNKNRHLFGLPLEKRGFIGWFYILYILMVLFTLPVGLLISIIFLF